MRVLFEIPKIPYSNYCNVELCQPFCRVAQPVVADGKYYVILLGKLSHTVLS